MPDPAWETNAELEHSVTVRGNGDKRKSSEALTSPPEKPLGTPESHPFVSTHPTKITLI